jgi:hypothetical protein
VLEILLDHVGRQVVEAGESLEEASALGDEDDKRSAQNDKSRRRWCMIPRWNAFGAEEDRNSPDWRHHEVSRFCLGFSVECPILL